MMSETMYVKARDLCIRLEGKSYRSRLQVQDRITKLLNDNDLYTEAAIFEDMTMLMREMVLENMHIKMERRLKKARNG
jgi:hypothetical protein